MIRNQSGRKTLLARFGQTEGIGAQTRRTARPVWL